MDNILAKLSAFLEKDKKHKEYNQQYENLKTDEDRVIWTLKILKEYNETPIVNVCDKNSDRSIEFRIQGNTLYSKQSDFNYKNLDDTVKLYTMSVAYAPPQSLELALAYGNRSAALFTARLYSHCFIDIQRALDLNYPEEKKMKLYTRAIRCLKFLPTLNESDSISKFASSLKEIAKNSKDKILVDVYMNPPRDPPPRILLDDARNLPKIPNDNEEVPGASSAIAICYSETYGRHLIATRDIEPGEIIAAQRSYEWVLTSERYYRNCWNCSRQVWNAIPCNYCVTAIYCDEKCRDEAWNHAHDIECQVIGPLISLELSNLMLLSIRLCIKGMREAGSIKKLMKKLSLMDSHTDERTKGFTNNIFNHQKFESVYSLVRNTEKRSVPDLFGRSLTACTILYMLATRSKMFGEKIDGDLKTIMENKLMTFIGGLIMRCQQLIPNNVHSMSDESILHGPVTRAAALMPFFSLTNHSCAPNVFRTSHGTLMLLTSENFIKKGEQIFDTYGQIYPIRNKKHRQFKLMRQFQFTCNCIACVENWPIYDEIPSFTDQSLRRDVKLKILNAVKNYLMYVKIVDSLDMKNSEEMVKDLLKMIKVLRLNAKMPCIELNHIVETFKRVKELDGNRWQSLNSSA